jgi:hypothetical protein
MPYWEYREIHLSQLPRRTNEVDLLNDAGEDGWELVNVTRKNVAYLKRQVAAAPIVPAGSSRRKTPVVD